MNTVPKADEQSFPNAKKPRKVERKGEKKKITHSLVMQEQPRLVVCVCVFPS